MSGTDAAERIEGLVLAMNTLFRAKGGARLEVRAIHDAGRGKYHIRTDLVDADGARHKRQESPELTPEQSIKHLETLLASLKKA